MKQFRNPVVWLLAMVVMSLGFGPAAFAAVSPVFQDIVSYEPADDGGLDLPEAAVKDSLTVRLLPGAEQATASTGEADLKSASTSYVSYSTATMATGAVSMIEQTEFG